MAFLALCLVSLVVLVVLDALQNAGLWGDFIFAFLLMTGLIALAGHAIPDARWERWGVVPPTTSYAPFWAMFILLAVPLAIVSRWWGPPVLLLVLAVLWWKLPSGRLAVGFTTAAMLIFVWLLSALTGPEQPTVGNTVSLHGADALAHRYRPILLFDSDEQYAPVDVAHAFSVRHVKACHLTLGGDSCSKIASPSGIGSDTDFLEVAANTLGPADDTGGADSAIYYHAVERSRPPRVYLDYWWFFTENPQSILSLVLCRTGLRVGEITCFRHAADWEGVTVVLAPCGVEPQMATTCVRFGDRRLHLIAVDYAEHNGAKRLAWDSLKQQWKRRAAPIDGERPVVYVALRSHAAYPRACPPRCGREKSNDGAVPWGNNGPMCTVGSRDCVQELPIDAAGKPSSWNAFPGPWGPQHCILERAYCDGGPAPPGPALHGRYRHPDRTG